MPVKGKAKQHTQAKTNDNQSPSAFLVSFLEKVPENSKHADIEELFTMIRAHAPTLDPELQVSNTTTLAFGGFDYQTKSKCSGRWSRIGVVANKTLYTLRASRMGHTCWSTTTRKPFGGRAPRPLVYRLGSAAFVSRSWKIWTWKLWKKSFTRWKVSTPWTKSRRLSALLYISCL